MTDILRPYTEFDSQDLALQLHEAVIDNTSMLVARNILGPIVRYGADLELAQEKIEKGQREHAAGKLGHFAVVGRRGDVVGLASIYPDLPLRKLRLPIPSGLARGKLAVSLPYATPNVHAWASDTDLLAGTYGALKTLSHAAEYQRIVGTDLELPWHIGSAWTVEPKRSPKEIHDSISAAGFERIMSARFDEGESRRQVPPRGVLYADLNSRWRTRYGAQCELRDGRRSRRDSLQYETTTRNPRG